MFPFHRIPAVFSWQLQDDNTLTKPGVIQLEGAPLDVTLVSTGQSSCAVAAALHLPKPLSSDVAQSLVVLHLTLSEGRLTVENTHTVNDVDGEATEVDVTEADVRSLFYTVEHLRKQQANAADDGESQDGASATAE